MFQSSNFMKWASASDAGNLYGYSEIKISKMQSVNCKRRISGIFDANDFVFVIKQAEATGKCDSGMRGPYRVVKALPHGRYELQLLAGSCCKTIQVAEEYMVPWRREWIPDPDAYAVSRLRRPCVQTMRPAS